jgi:hypothetical protein
MKKLLASIIFLFIVNVGFGQSAKPSAKDSVKTDSVNIATPLLSVNDVTEIINALSKKFTIDQISTYQEITKMFDEKIRQRITEYYSKQKK